MGENIPVFNFRTFLGLLFIKSMLFRNTDISKLADYSHYFIFSIYTLELACIILKFKKMPYLQYWLLLSKNITDLGIYSNPFDIS